MSNIKILCVGKIKEKFYRDAIGEYEKRLSRYCRLSIIEVADEKRPDRSSETEEMLIKEKEATRLRSHIRDNDYVIALAIDGKSFDSVTFAEHLGVGLITVENADHRFQNQSCMELATKAVLNFFEF